MTKAKEKLLQRYIDTGLEPEEIKQAYDMYLEIYSKVSEYADLMRQGLLIKLPCKLGTKVYVVDNDFDGCTLKIYETSYNLGLYEYGAKIFLTREEAEKALLEVKE